MSQMSCQLDRGWIKEIRSSTEFYHAAVPGGAADRS